MDRIAKKYLEKFKTSKELYEKSKQFFPKGVCHDIRNYPPFPVVTEKCEDIYMFDRDGNRLVDLWMGHYALLLGHGNPSQKRGLERALQAGIHHGTLNTLQIEFAELVQEAIPELQSMRFCTSGTEATMYVTRVARAHSKKPVIVKAEGGWHGGNSTLSTGIQPPFMSKKSAPEGQKTIFVPYNDVEKTSEILEFHKDEIGGIIIEPMLGAGGGIVASDEYLKMLRSFCDANGALLIFDEVITGFRFRYGSIWNLLGTCPDLFTFGKASAGGMHIGIYGGRREVMESIERESLFAGGGTYSANPASMAVGIETLKSLKDADYDSLNAEGEKMLAFLKNESAKLKIPTAVTGFGSFFCVHFLKKEGEATPDFVMANSDKEMEQLFKAVMLTNDVFTMHSGGALSFKHMESQTIDKIKDAYLKSFNIL